MELSVPYGRTNVVLGRVDDACSMDQGFAVSRCVKSI